jgi:hypothetical protein
LEQLALTVAKACAAARIGRTTLYEAIKRGDLVAAKYRRKTLICIDDLRSWRHVCQRLARTRHRPAHPIITAGSIEFELTAECQMDDVSTLPDIRAAPVSQGWSVFPLQPRGKNLLCEWKKFQMERASLEQLREWARRECNIGIVTGRIFKIVVLDLDSEEAIAEAKRLTACGRICMHRKKINISTVLAGQKLGIKEVDDGIWLVTFMHYDLGYIDLEQRTLQTIDNRFGTRLSPMS